MKVILAAALLVLLGILFFVTQMPSDNRNGTGDLVSVEESLIALLRSVPDRSETRLSVVVNNYALADSSLGISRPGENANYQDVIDYAFLLSTRGSLETGTYIAGDDENSRTSLAVLKANAGFDLRNVQLSLSAGFPPQEYEAVLLDLEASEILARMLSSQAWDPPTQRRHGGIQTLHWDDAQDGATATINPPAINQMGQGADLAFVEKLLFYTSDEANTNSMIDAHRGSVQSLADSPEFLALAKGVAELGLYSAVLSDGTQSIDSLVQTYSRIHPGEEEIAAYRAALESEITLRSYRAFAAGIGNDSGGYYMGLALVHGDAEDAEANEILLRTRLQGEGIESWSRDWSIKFDLSRAEFAVSGTLLTAKVPFSEDEPSNQWVEWLYLRDGLLLHD